MANQPYPKRTGERLYLPDLPEVEQAAIIGMCRDFARTEWKAHLEILEGLADRYALCPPAQAFSANIDTTQFDIQCWSRLAHECHYVYRLAARMYPTLTDAQILGYFQAHPDFNAYVEDADYPHWTTPLHRGAITGTEIACTLTESLQPHNETEEASA